MIGISSIFSALKQIIGTNKKGLNVEMPLTAATPIKLATAIELAKNDYDTPKNIPIPFIIAELADPPNMAEKPVFNFRLLEKEIPDIDSINEKLSKLEKRVDDLEKEVAMLRQEMYEQVEEEI